MRKKQCFTFLPTVLMVLDIIQTCSSQYGVAGLIYNRCHYWYFNNLMEIMLSFLVDCFALG